MRSVHSAESILDGHNTVWKYMGCSMGYSSSVYAKTIHCAQDFNTSIWVSILHIYFISRFRNIGFAVWL